MKGKPMPRHQRSVVSLLSVLFLIGAGHLSAQERPTVAVLPLKHTGQAELAQVAATVEDTIVVAFKLLERYRYVEPGEGSWNGQERELRRVSEAQAIDNVIFGAVEEAAGGVKLSLSVYSRAEGRVVLQETGTTDSFLDIFNLTDTILLALLGGFTESRVAFGEVRFENSGVERSYVVRSGGQSIGRNIRRLERVVSGRRSFEIVDDALGRTVLNESVRVVPGEPAVVRFHIPFLYPDEEEGLLRAERLVGESWYHRGGSDGVKAALEAATAELRELQGRPTEAMEARYRELADRYEAARSSNRGSIDYYPIDLDDGLEQWEAVPFKIIDTGSRSAGGDNPLPVESQPGSDIAGLKLARDAPGENLYFLITLANGAPSTDVLYSLNFHHDDFEYYEFRLLPLLGGWRPELRIWRRDNTTETLLGNFDFVRGDSWIMGSVDIERCGLRDMMKKHTYSCNVKSEHSDDRSSYNITRSALADLYPPRSSELPELPEAGELRWIRQASGLPGMALDEGLAVDFERTNHLPRRRIDVDGAKDDWRGLSWVANSWEQRGVPSVSRPQRLYLAKDRRNLYILLETDGGADLLPQPGTIAELEIEGDMMDETWQYSLELRIQEYNAYVSYRKESGRRDEGVHEPERRPQGRYAVSDDGRVLEMSFPLTALEGYLEERASYEALFRIWEIEGAWTITTPRFLLAPY